MKKLFIFFLLIFILTGCSLVNEGLISLNVSGEIKNLKPVFYKKEILNYGKDPRQYLIIYYPEIIRNNKIIFYIHGGGWEKGSPESHEVIADYFNRKGYIVVMPSYRFSDKASYQEIIEDIFNSFVFSDQYLSEKNISYRYIISGSSAGGTMAAQLISDVERQKSKNILKDKFCSLITFAGALNFTKCKNSYAVDKIQRYTKNSENYKDANPIKYYMKNDVISFFIHSVDDGIVEYESSKSYAESMKLSNMNNGSLITLKNLTHSQTIFLPFIRDGEERKILEEILDIINNKIPQ